MKILKYILGALIVASCVMGCMKYDELEHEIAPDVDSDESSMISFVIPTMNDVVTRADDIPNDTAIKNGYLFVFSSAKTYKGHMEIGAISEMTLNTPDDAPSFYSFKIDAANANYQSGDKIVAVFNYDTDKTISIDTNNLTISKINEIFPLDASYLAAINTDIDTCGIPMAVNDFEDNGTSTYHEVYRALARLEVFLRKDMHTDASDTSHSHEFNTTNVTYAVVNAITSGTIVEDSKTTLGTDSNAMFGGTGSDESKFFVYNLTSADIATDDVEVDNEGHSDSTTDTTVDGVEGENRVYLYPYNYATNFINGNTTEETTYSSDRFALLLKHGAASSHNHGDQYYKLNLVDRANDNKYYDLKRNHSYRVIITKVHSDGYDTAQEAYDAPPSNIEYEIYDDQGDATLSNGQYAISMDEVVNYNQIDIYGHNETVVSFDNINYVIPKEMVDVDMTKITNNIKVTYDTKGSDLSVSVDNPFDLSAKGGSGSTYEETGELTDKPQNIKFTVKGSGTCKIGLEIQLGNLKTGVGEITINKNGSSGEGALDAHPIQLRYENREYVKGSWRSASPINDFGARIANAYDDEEANRYNPDGATAKDISMVLYMGHNATPVGFNTMDGSYTSGAAEDSYPIFAEKTREGYYTYTDTTDPSNKKTITTKVMATQLAPYYIGHFGRENDGTSTHHYKAVIVERIEEIQGGSNYEYWNDDSHTTSDQKDGSATRGTIQWSSEAGQYYSGTIWGNINGMDRYRNFVDGWSVCNNIATNPSVNSKATAVMYCYMKNDVNGNGEIDPNEPIEWYLPAQNQMVGFWISKKQFDNDHNSRGTYYINEAENSKYWTSSEFDSNGNQWNKPSRFDTHSLLLDMMEGMTPTHLTKQDKAHVRCMRGVDSY